METYVWTPKSPVCDTWLKCWLVRNDTLLVCDCTPSVSNAMHQSSMSMLDGGHFRVVSTFNFTLHCGELLNIYSTSSSSLWAYSVI